MSAINLERALDFTLAEEGGWSNHPEDSGHETNFGITLGVLKGLGRDWDLDQDGTADGGDLDKDGDVDADDLKIMTKDQARAIYRRLYWQGDGFRNGRVAIKHFDIGVNAGKTRANILLQRAYNAMNGKKILEEDGKLGPKTQAAVNAADPDKLLYQLCITQAGFYRSIVSAKPAKAVFLAGWLARARRRPV
jgi:lysozyme family protein